MTDITPERLAQIKARADGLPHILIDHRGPWYVTGDGVKDSNQCWLFQASGTLNAQLAELANYAHAARQDIPDRIAALEAAQVENAKLREALETFAASENWQLNGVCDPNSGNFEGQAIAHAALEAKL